jgi:hypothetical protein
MISSAAIRRGKANRKILSNWLKATRIEIRPAGSVMTVIRQHSDESAYAP